MQWPILAAKIVIFLRWEKEKTENLFITSAFGADVRNGVRRFSPFATWLSQGYCVLSHPKV
jgi:hypothetical protein